MHCVRLCIQDSDARLSNQTAGAANCQHCTTSGRKVEQAALQSLTLLTGPYC